MQFSVPQFIDVEDKIVGPLTLKQFLFLLGGAGVAFVFYTLFSLPVFLILSSPIALVAGLFAFYKPNGRPFSDFVGAIARYLFRPRLYRWQRTAENRGLDTTAAPATTQAVDHSPQSPTDVSESRLKQLAWVLDTSGGLEERQAIAENLKRPS